MSCPVCLSRDYKSLLKKKGFVLLKCAGCRLIYVDGLQDKFDIRHYDYYKDRIGLDRSELYNPLTEKRYVDLLKKMEPYRQTGSIFELGCGQGHFLSIAEKMGWRAQGIEKAPYAVEICRRFNLNVSSGDLLEMNLAQEHYDAAMMFEVLEHLTQPKDYLLKINAILRKGGILIITTPNFNCITRFLLRERWSQINEEHLLYFTPHSLESILTRYNFRIVEFKVRHITLPELYRLFKDREETVYERNQAIRKAVEENKFLSFMKLYMNKFLDLTRTGESIECVCQKI